jgi:hypothetical protein
MLPSFKKTSVINILKAIFIFLFVYTAFSKLLDFQSFNIVLRRSPLIGRYHHLVTIFLPSSEILVAALLFFPATVKIGLWSFFSMMLLFTGYIVYMLVFSPYLPCSCGGVIKFMSWKNHLLFNGLIITLAVIALVLNSKMKTNPKP